MIRATEYPKVQCYKHSDEQLCFIFSEFTTDVWKLPRENKWNPNYNKLGERGNFVPPWLTDQTGLKSYTLILEFCPDCGEYFVVEGIQYNLETANPETISELDRLMREYYKDMGWSEKFFQDSLPFGLYRSFPLSTNAEGQICVPGLPEEPVLEEMGLEPDYFQDCVEE